MITHPEVEARLLAAMIADEGVLEQCSMLELDDFTVFSHQRAFIAIRELQESKSEVHLLAVCDAMEMRDMQRGAGPPDADTAVFLGCLMIDCPKYNHYQLVAADIRNLRIIRNANEAAAR